MLADTYTLNGVAFTKRSSAPGSAIYTDGGDILTLRTLSFKYQTDRKGVKRTLVDISANFPDADGRKIDHVQRDYFNIVMYPSDTAADVKARLLILSAIIAHATLPDLILDETV